LSVMDKHDGIVDVGVFQLIRLKTVLWML
jgi:hypothetical protein